MSRLRPSDKAWLALAAGVAAWELYAPEGELLSEAADRWMLTHPWITRVCVATIAAHLCNAIPNRYDPLHLLFDAKRLMRRYSLRGEPNLQT